MIMKLYYFGFKNALKITMIIIMFRKWKFMSLQSDSDLLPNNNQDWVKYFKTDTDIKLILNCSGEILFWKLEKSSYLFIKKCFDEF